MGMLKGGVLLLYMTSPDAEICFLPLVFNLIDTIDIDRLIRWQNYLSRKEKWYFAQVRDALES